VRRTAKELVAAFDQDVAAARFAAGARAAPP